MNFRSLLVAARLLEDTTFEFTTRVDTYPQRQGAGPKVYVVGPLEAEVFGWATWGLEFDLAQWGVNEIKPVLKRCDIQGSGEYESGEKVDFRARYPDIYQGPPVNINVDPSELAAYTPIETFNARYEPEGRQGIVLAEVEIDLNKHTVDLVFK